jgi:hypothetical protein
MSCDKKCDGEYSDNVCIKCINEMDRYPTIMLIGCNIALSTVLCVYSVVTAIKLIDESIHTEDPLKIEDFYSIQV